MRNPKSLTFPCEIKGKKGTTNLELLAVHGGDFSLLADGKGVGHRLSGGLGGDDKVIAFLLDLSDWLDVLGHLDDILGEIW